MNNFVYVCVKKQVDGYYATRGVFTHDRLEAAKLFCEVFGCTCITHELNPFSSELQQGLLPYVVQTDRGGNVIEVCRTDYCNPHGVFESRLPGVSYYYCMATSATHAIARVTEHRTLDNAKEIS